MKFQQTFICTGETPVPPRRVDDAKKLFEKVGAKVHTYQWRKYKGFDVLDNVQLADAQRLNVDWLKRKIRKGDRIFDIGIPADSIRNRGLGDFYSVELEYLGRKLRPVQRGTININGEAVDLWEWVLD